jgi:hypothetical protein
MRRIFSLIIVSIIFNVPIATAEEDYIGNWKQEIHGEDIGTVITSVHIERYGNVFVGSVVEGSSGGRIWTSKLKGTIKDDKLYTRICAENDELINNDKNINECLDGTPDNYFMLKDNKLLWFRKSAAQSAPYLILQHEKKAKKS